jgi:uncharacterized surface protein with fasciclin (FAS1) repeats
MAQLVMLVVLVAMASCAVLVSGVQQSRSSTRPMFFDEFVVEPGKDVTASVAGSSTSSKTGTGGSILQALLESQYSEFIYYLEKASLLHKLENVVSIKGSLTIFAPKNSFLEQQLDVDFRNFLQQDGNEMVLQRVLQFHVLPVFLDGAGWSNRSVISLSGDALNLRSYGLKRYVDFSRVFSPNSIIRDDGIVHGVNGFLIPRGVSSQFEEWKRSGKLAVLPQSAPVGSGGRAAKHKNVNNRGNPPSLPSSSKLTAAAPSPLSAFIHFASGPAFAPAPAPGPSQESFSWDETEEVSQFIITLTNFGGYNDMAELLVNYTSLATEIGRLIKKGYRLTILAPNDDAMAQLTPEHLNSPLERILYYHILSEYQTEESMYNAVRRLGKQTYSTLLHPRKLLARESDGTVLFGEGEDSAHIYDHDIYVDGRLSIQGISKVLIPPPDTPAPSPST